MRTKKYVLQQDSKDCAVSCLFNIIKHFGGNIDINKLNKMLNTNKNGTSIYDIVNTSSKLGINANSYKCELNDLHNLNYPLIAVLKIDNKYDHFVIIDKIVDYKVYTFDPVLGYVNYDIENFEKEWTNIVIIFEKTDKIVNEKEITFISYIIMYLLKNFNIILFVFILSVISVIFTIIHSLYYNYLYNYSTYQSLIFYLFILLIILKSIIDYIRNRFIIKYSKSFDETVTNNTFSKILSLPIVFHHNRPVGDILSRINDLSSLKEFVNNISFFTIIDVLYILMISIILFILNKKIYILLILLLLIYIFVYLLFRNKIKDKILIVKNSFSNSNTFLVESIFGIDTIKNLNIEIPVKKIFNQKYKKYLKENNDLNKLIMYYNVFDNFYSNFCIVVIVYFCFIFFNNGYFTFSNIFIFNTLTFNLFISLKNILSLDQLFVEANTSFKRLKSLYNEQINNTYKITSINQINNIQFKNLYYSYNYSHSILKKINYSINKGDYVFVTGKSGTGKSTIFKLLTKQLEIENNMIYINGIDINKISNDVILNNICYVSQNEYIFTDTILNNIKLYKEAKEEEINKVIKITKIDEFMKKKNINLNFLLEENGHNLSGGERQRIILARSLLQNKKVLILDETLNELDIQSEKEILKEIKNNYKITLILISHRDNNSKMFNKKIKI